MPNSPRRAPAWLPLGVFVIAVGFACVRAHSIMPAVFGDGVAWSVRALLLAQWCIEVLFAFGIAGSSLLSLAYLFGGRRPGAMRASDADTSGLPDGRVAILYLCCGDFDRDAIESLLRLRARGGVELWLHDDLPGGDPVVDSFLRQVSSAMPIQLLRRPDKVGGKPGAINWVLEQQRGRADFLLLCDNDSIAVDADCLAALLRPMADERVAVVQARNVPVTEPSQCTINRSASRAIDVFHLFLDVGSRLGWMPFVGHNALLRIAAVEQVGGMQPGCFADDIDLTLRLQLAGFRTSYAPHVAIGERHPPNYAAFRKRAYKWACGSTQVLRRWTLPVLRSRRLALAEKWGFLHFMGFFPLQAMALVYTALAFLVAPFVLDAEWGRFVASFVAGSVMPVLIFLPVLAFALRERWWRGFGAFLGVCWLCYGAADFPTARGALHGLSQRQRRWVPTNGVRGGCDRSMFCEACFGVAILLVPLWQFPELLLSPLTVLIASKFLLLPTIGQLYQDGVRPRGARRRLPLPLERLLRVGVVLLALAGLARAVTGQDAPQAQGRDVAVRGDQLLVDGSPYVVRGVHYGPWRPGTGPGRSDYPERALLAEDMALIAGLHANTIFTFDPPRELLDVAHEHGLMVLVGFWLEWPQFAQPAFVAAEDGAVRSVGELRDHPAVLGWVLGNEIPSWVVTQQGVDVVEARLEALHDRIREVDPVHPVTHANWPTTRGLDLSFLEICAFNVYALWPPEVVGRGYGNFIKDVLQPLAAGRPLLITEFGANALEAGIEGQARLDRDCWQGLRAAGAVGGFVFEFADEWWKNYSNPKLAPAWWDRDTALDDHLAHDEDPEEHYGLFDGERRAKPAARAVAVMYGASEPPVVETAPPADVVPAGEHPRQRPWLMVTSVLGAAGALYLLTARMRARDRHAADTVDEHPREAP